jgi:ribosome biogenesis GTPase
LHAHVLAQYRGLWLVAPGTEDPRLVPARGKLADTPVTGDVVRLDEGGAIAAIEPRRGTIVRRAPGEDTSGQVLAANVDLALVTEPLPEPNARRLERFAALAAGGGVQVALALTKADLDEEAQVVATRLGRRLGVVDAVAVSAVTGEGMGILRHLLAPGTTTVLIGASGTGKSTLVNALLAVTPRSLASCSPCPTARG